MLVPAHDEASMLGATLDSLAGLDYPAAGFEVVVVADNCTDATAEVARARGVLVVERHDPGRPGKGRALAWALDRLGAADGGLGDAVVFVDADCEVAPELLSAFDARLERGARALQADYRVANPEASRRAALRYAGFALQNVVRPAGRGALGLSAGLHGTGMALHADVLRAVPWESFSLAEDREHHLRLVAAGERVEFVPEVWVRTPVPARRGEAAVQEARWESGRLALARRHSPGLMATGLRSRDRARVDAALEPLVPSQAATAALNLGALALGTAARDRVARRAAAAALGAQAVFVFGGLRAAGAPPSVYRALAGAPAFAAGRLGLLARALVRAPRTWVRSPRPGTETGGSAP